MNIHLENIKRQGHIIRQGRAVLRKILVQAAWVAIEHDTALLQIYERIANPLVKNVQPLGLRDDSLDEYEVVLLMELYMNMAERMPHFLLRYLNNSVN